MFEQSHALTRLCPVLGGKGGNGFPSANSVTADLGGKGGNGFPSATSVPAAIEASFDGSGDMGLPSALVDRSIVTGLPAERLTDRTTGSTIKTARTETATASVVFFMGGALLEAIVRRESVGGGLRLKMFRLRDTGRHETVYTVQEKPPSHSGLHTDNSCGHSWAICPAGLPGFLAGSLQRPL